MKNLDNSKRKLHRVDLQVSLFTAFIVIVSCLCLYIFAYYITYSDMILSLSERVESIYSYLEEEMDPKSFININSKEDMNSEIYHNMKELFHDVKKSTGVQYLYTAKRNDKGEFIYVIDGLDYSAKDFRYPGDLIEKEIVDDLNRALSGEKIMPDNILHTTWGNIFITYLPIHDKKGTVIGAIGIEFSAEHQYNTYHLLRIITPIILIISCLVCALFAVLFFRRISNPHFQDMANTDYLTGLKNRNAFEIDMKNMCAVGTAVDVGFIISDLNGLKRVNDTLGHEFGDTYIKMFADAMRDVANNKAILYRLGGDEFGILVEKADIKILHDLSEQIEKVFIENSYEIFPMACSSFGYAICKGNLISDFEEAYRVADAMMYHNKKEYYDKINCV